LDRLDKALLVTDLEDSTALVESLGDTSMSNLGAVHDRIARDLLERWRGQEIDKTDGFLLLFDRVEDALGYADGYHSALVELSRLSDGPIRARAGLHYGRVILRENPPEDVAAGPNPSRLRASRSRSPHA
jgi:class 3 adenylate cyclase